MFFTTEGRANYYDCDCNNRLKISAAMKYMQQTSSEQLEHLEISTEKLLSEQLVFLLSKMCIKVHRMPVCSEPLIVGTAPTLPRGARFVREFIIESPQGERLLSALSLWILVNSATRRILRPASFPYPIPFQEEALSGVIGDIAFPGKALEKASHTSVPICYSHIDVNRHVNNTVYADIVCDALPYEQLTSRGIDTMAISFQNEAKWGQILDVASQEVGEGEYHIVGQHGGPCFEALALLRKTE